MGIIQEARRFTLLICTVASVNLLGVSHAEEVNSAETVGETIELEGITVEGRGEDLTGIANSASQGRTGRAQLETRPILRPAEVLETVPGLVATQHSGEGKANQYFLRGFNLDHGSDFATSIDGIPFNLPSHGHAQGWLDINFLIPELVDEVEFKKGVYYADVGDFSSAGSANIRLARRLDKNILKTEIGEDDFYRVLVAGSPKVGDGHLLYALQPQYYNGPWTNPENNKKISGILKYTGGDDERGYSLSALGYYAEWEATDQIAQRAVDQGLISRFGTLDPALNNDTERYTVAGDWWNTGENDSLTKLNVYASYYTLDLFSNFTYFLDDPVNGDQFEQVDRRGVFGANTSHQWFNNWFGKDIDNTLGLQLRHDEVFDVALYQTREGERQSTTRQDEIGVTSLGLYLNNEIKWADKLRTIIGLRGDFYRFAVDSSIIPANSGNETDVIFSPKLGLILGPWYSTEFYVNAGLGFHSNDARGTTTVVDPVTGEPTEQVDPLVRSTGAEIGLRSTLIPGLNSTFALWFLELDSELVFVGDVGNTEASDKSRRFGAEWNNFYQATDWLSLDFDLALTDAQFVDNGPGNREIDNSVDTIVAAGATVRLPNGFNGSMRVRHSGARPLNGDGSVESEPTTLVNMRLGYQLKKFDVGVDVLNLLDSNDSDISYFYTSRLQGEAAEGVDDIHFHPVNPRQIRLFATWNF